LALFVLSVVKGFYRKAYMKRLDKPTNSLCGNLLNIKKNSIVSAKDLVLVECSDRLVSKTLFSCLTVSNQSGGNK
jgi:hypothetical protein